LFTRLLASSTGVHSLLPSVRSYDLAVFLSRVPSLDNPRATAASPPTATRVDVYASSMGGTQGVNPFGVRGTATNARFPAIAAFLVLGNPRGADDLPPIVREEVRIPFITFTLAMRRRRASMFVPRRSVTVPVGTATRAAAKARVLSRIRSRSRDVVFFFSDRRTARSSVCIFLTTASYAARCWRASRSTASIFFFCAWRFLAVVARVAYALRHMATIFL